MNVIIGKIVEAQKEKRGWLVGQFYPDGSPFQDKNLEICYKVFPVGDPGDRLHYHPEGREYLIVLEGKARMQVGTEVILLEKNDYVVIPNNTNDSILEVLEEFTFVGMRYPSIPDNKVLVE